jgi:hypothetical protein
MTGQQMVTLYTQEKAGKSPARRRRPKNLAKKEREDKKRKRQEEKEERTGVVQVTQT